jgi:hypothetical protein
MRDQMQGLFAITGIALIVAGLNNSYPLAIAGGAIVFLALLGRYVGRRKN